SARSGELVELGRDPELGLLDVSPVEVDFDAGDDRTILPVVAGMTAEDAALRAEAGNMDAKKRIDLGIAPAVAAVDAEIEPGPVLHDRRRSLVDRRLDGEIRRPCSPGAHHHCGEQAEASPKLATHYGPSSCRKLRCVTQAAWLALAG